MKLLKNAGLNIETLLILLIAGCILFINAFTVRKLNELESAGTSAIFIKDDIKVIEDEKIREEIKEYIPETYKMIELYDENLDILFQAKFNGSDEIIMNDIRKYKNLTELLLSKDEGQTVIDINGKEQSIYFRWVTNTRDEKRLLIVYSTLNKVRGIWLFSFACYITLILVFILLIRLHSKSYHDKINQYHYLTRSLRMQLKD